MPLHVDTERENGSSQLEHIATFLETDYELDPNSILFELSHLNTNLIIPSICKLAFNPNGIDIIQIDTNEVLETAKWSYVHSPDVIVPTGRDYEQRILFVFRSRASVPDTLGYRNQLFVFGVESEREGSLLTGRMLAYQRKHIGSDSPHAADPLSDRWERSSKASTNKALRLSRNAINSSYGRNVYMLNRCLDDIQHFGKRLNKCVKVDSNGTTILKSDSVQVPTRYAAIDCVRKIKYSLNLNQEVEADAPEAAQKVFIRLIKFVRWLDGIARSRVVPNFDENLVRDVIEPLLTDRTLEAVRERLTPPLEEFWNGLGAPWNTSLSQWPNPITTYIPLFHTTPKDSMADSVRQRIFRTSSSADLTSPIKNTKVMVKYSRPRIRNKEHEHFFMKIQERGGRLCFATVHHVSSKESELDADQGEVFEIIDSTKDECWTVENYSGDRGEIPKWKLRSFTLKPRMYQKEKIPKKSARHEDTIFFPSPSGGLLQMHSNSRSQPIGPFMNVAYTPVEIPYPINTIPSDGSTMMVYLPIQQIGGTQGQGSPVLLVPYRSKSHDQQYQSPGRSDHVRDDHHMSGSFPYQQSPVSGEFAWPYKINRREDFETASRFGHAPLPSSRLLKYSHPHSPSPYDPTIVLDTKYKPKAARI
ncbi:hypothetical protein PHET_01682 [Paragonimus heterotremus]|uniref:EPS8 spectrin-like domain-containing protein n=1 Tax=Paragonimus heterotremus TaxID=100268 RepID=A0A8J4THC8_9TREM|nr:hypothetical protein PHET_01682 [Paragonimus heterotremus]